jgi:hypothetical protein
VSLPPQFSLIIDNSLDLWVYTNFADRYVTLQSHSSIHLVNSLPLCVEFGSNAFNYEKQIELNDNDNSVFEGRNLNQSLILLLHASFPQNFEININQSLFNLHIFGYGSQQLTRIKSLPSAQHLILHNINLSLEASMQNSQFHSVILSKSLIPTISLTIDTAFVFSTLGED